MKYAVLQYGTKNIGDDMQSLAASRFLPGKIARLSRERLDSPLLLLSRYKAIMNGWFMHKPEHWPPARTIDPLIISFHLNGAVPERTKILLGGKNLEWFKTQAAGHGVGTRDMSSLKRFQDAGVDAYFSGCLTMTMRPPEDIVKTDEILMIDIDPAAAAALKARTREPITELTQIIPPRTPQKERLRLVTERFRRLCSAKAVVTKRIHVAFPCLAVGTPVLMIHPERAEPRFGGIVDHLHFATPEEVVSGRYEFDLANPPANKNTHLGLVREMERRCEAFVRDVK